MKIMFNGDQPVILQAVLEANAVLKNPEFYEIVAQHDQFDMANISPALISGLIKASTLEFKVNVFQPTLFTYLKYYKTYAYTDSNFPNTLFLNANKLARQSAEIAATIIHESVHAVNNTTIYEFGHGDNSSAGKKNTTPYWIGNLAYQLLTNTRPLANQLGFTGITVNS
jgi:hypothetical protein